jgi:hypothetical protein
MLGPIVVTGAADARGRSRDQQSARGRQRLLGNDRGRISGDRIGRGLGAAGRRAASRRPGQLLALDGCDAAC